MTRLREDCSARVGARAAVVAAAFAFAAFGSSCLVTGAEDEYERCVIAGRCVADGGSSSGGDASVDGGAADSGADAGGSDGGEGDAGLADAGSSDAGAPDAGQDGGVPDAGGQVTWPPTGWTNPHPATAWFPPTASYPTVADDGETLCYQLPQPRSAPRVECRLLDGGMFGPATGTSSTEAISGSHYALSGDGDRLYFTISFYDVKWATVTNGLVGPSGIGIIGGSGATNAAAHPGNPNYLLAVDTQGQLFEHTGAGADVWLPYPDLNDTGMFFNREVDVAPNGEFIVFTRADNFGGAQLLMASRRTDAGWEAPIPLTLEGVDVDSVTSPELLRDGRLLFFGRRLDAGTPTILFADPKP